MRFTLKDIKGAVVDKKKHGCLCSPAEVHKTSKEADCCDSFCCADKINQAIDAQSQVRLQINREKLAKLLWMKITSPSADIIRDWDNNSPFAEKHWKPGYLGIADAIIASDKELIEVVK